MTEERFLRVPIHMLGAVVAWVTGILMMAVGTTDDIEDLVSWSLLVIAVAAVWSVSCIATMSRSRLIDAFDLQLRMHAVVAKEQDLPRVPTLR